MEVWATINSSESEQQWINLVNGLSGLFCASLNFIDHTRTARPKFIFQADSQGDLFHGSLPSEVVCTENLTPFLKLLPCKGHAGISSLLSGHKIFDTDWTSFAIDVNVANSSIQVVQNIDMVINLVRTISRIDQPIPKSQPEDDLNCNVSKCYSTEMTCFPQDSRSSQEWSFSQIFGVPIRRRCATSSLSEFQIYLKHNGSLPSPPPSYYDGQVAAYNLSNGTLDIQCSDPSFSVPISAPITAHRSLTSHGMSLGGKITLDVTSHSSTNLDIIYYSILPWYVRPYLHSSATSHADVMGSIHYVPARDRTRPAQIEFKLTIPPKQRVFITFDFDKTVLRYSEYPPDANRGFDIA